MHSFYIFPVTIAFFAGRCKIIYGKYPQTYTNFQVLVREFFTYIFFMKEGDAKNV